MQRRALDFCLFFCNALYAATLHFAYRRHRFSRYRFRHLCMESVLSLCLIDAHVGSCQR